MHDFQKYSLRINENSQKESHEILVEQPIRDFLSASF